MPKPNCNCGGTFKDQTVEFEGFDLRGLKCNKCGELTFMPEQFKKIITLGKLV